jgi:hypothetical protein
MRLSRFGLIVMSAASLLAARPSDTGKQRAEAALASLPLRFEANQGQWKPAVRYATHGGRYAIALTQAGPAISFADSHRVDLRLEGSNRASEIEPLERAPGRTSFFVGSKDRWRGDVPAYSRVRYREVYPGIDVVYYGVGGVLEYDFELAPGADPSAIRLRFQGADRASIAANGDLRVECPGGVLTQKLPFIYQRDAKTGERRRVDGRYIPLADGAVGLRLDAYDRSRPLVVDPVLVYSSYWGGGAQTQVNCATLDSDGLLYVVGNDYGSDLTATSDSYETLNTAVGAYEIVLVVLDTTAAGDYAPKYITYLGGSGNDLPNSVITDNVGNIFIVGSTTSSDFPMVGNSVQATAPSVTSSVFVAEMHPSFAGTDGLVYSTYLGGSKDNFGQGIVEDANGFVYVIGTTSSTDLPVTDAAYSGILNNDANNTYSYDAFLVKLDLSSTTPVYESYLGGDGNDEGAGILLAPNGLVYFAINTDSTNFPLTASPYSGSFHGWQDIVVGAFDMNQTGADCLVYDTYFGGSSPNWLSKIALDRSGRVMMTGYTFSSDFPVTGDAAQGSYGGNGDAFVSIVDPLQPQAFLVYSTYLGGSDGDAAFDIAGDAGGSVYVTGYTYSWGFPITADAIQPAWSPGSDVFVTKILPGVGGYGGIQFSTFLGDPNYKNDGATGINAATALVLGPDGRVFVGGISDGTLPVVGDNTTPYGGSTSTGFVLAISQLAGQPVRNNRMVRTRARPSSPAPVHLRTGFETGSSVRVGPSIGVRGPIR